MIVGSMNQEIQMGIYKLIPLSFKIWQL